MTLEHLEYSVERAIGRIELLTESIGRGTFDDVDPILLRRLKNAAGELHSTLGIVQTVTQP